MMAHLSGARRSPSTATGSSFRPRQDARGRPHRKLVFFDLSASPGPTADAARRPRRVSPPAGGGPTTSPTSPRTSSATRRTGSAVPAAARLRDPGRLDLRRAASRGRRQLRRDDVGASCTLLGGRLQGRATTSTSPPPATSGRGGRASPTGSCTVSPTATSAPTSPSSSATPGRPRDTFERTTGHVGHSLLRAAAARARRPVRRRGAGHLRPRHRQPLDGQRGHGRTRQHRARLQHRQATTTSSRRPLHGPPCVGSPGGLFAGRADVSRPRALQTRRIALGRLQRDDVDPGRLHLLVHAGVLRRGRSPGEPRHR